MTEVAVEFHDAGPDSLGRRHFSMTWLDLDGVDRAKEDRSAAARAFYAERSKRDPLAGFRRAQHFFARPERYVQRGSP